MEVEPGMKTQRLAAILAMTAASLCAEKSAVTQKATVMVCMNSDSQALEGVFGYSLRDVRAYRCENRLARTGGLPR